MVCAIISSGDELLLKNKNEKEFPYPFIKMKLINIIWKLYCKGYDEFYLNCEYGVPLWAVEIICALKKHNQIKLNIVMPYEEQSKDWYEEYRDRFYNAHFQSDNVYMISTHYHQKCYEEANEFMISKADLVLILGKNKNLNYCKYEVKNNIPVIFYDVIS